MTTDEKELAKMFEDLPRWAKERWLGYAEGVADMREENERLKKELAEKSA